MRGPHQRHQAAAWLRRCRYHGTDGMARWVGLGVIADNLINTAVFAKARAAA
jgi:IS5 family transposase